MKTSVIQKLIFGLLFLGIVACQQSESFDTYKLFSYQQDRQLIGSRIGSLNILTIHHQSSQSMSRKLAVIKFFEINYDDLKSLMQKKPGGLLIILPVEKSNNKEQTQIWKIIMDFFGNKDMIIPIQFVFENEQVNQQYQNLAKNINAVGDQEEQYRFIVNSSNGSFISGKYQMEDQFIALDDSSSSRKKETILFVTSLDQFMPSQEFINKQNVSVSIFFAVIQQIQSVYQSYNVIGKNVLFYLTNSSSFQYEGLQQFFFNQDNAQYTSQISSIVLLDNLGAQKNIYIEQFGTSTNQYTEIYAQKLQQNNFKVVTNYFDKEISPLKIKTNRNIEIIRISDKQYSDLYYLQVNENPELSQSAEVVTSLVQGLVEIAYSSSEQKLMDMCIFKDTGYLEILNDTFNNSYRFINYLTQDSTLVQESRKLFKKSKTIYQKFSYQLQNVKLFTSQVGQAQFVKYQNPFLEIYFFLCIVAFLSVLYFLFGKTPIIVKNTKME